MAALVTAFAHDNQPTAGPPTPRAESGSVSDQLYSECGEDTRVFARPVRFGDRVFVVDLPAGVYLAKMIAVGDINLGTIGTYSPTERRPVVTVRSWFNDRERVLVGREVLGGEFTRWSGFIFTPGGTALVSVSISFGGPEQWALSSSWFLEIYAMGVCEPPEGGFDSGRTAEPTGLAVIETE